MDNTPKVLFLSRGNASRAQIAEGFLRCFGGSQFVAFSAGTESASVSPLATEIMSEAGIDISAQQVREVVSLFRETFHCVVALCDEARERYPVYPFTRNLLRWPVVDPDAVAHDAEERKKAFRQIRDQIKNKVMDLVEAMNEPKRVFAESYPRAA